MLSALRARLGARLPALSQLAVFTRQSTIYSVARPIVSTQSRTFLTSQRFEFAAKATPTKRTPAKKATKASSATKTKAKAGAAKKKPAKKPAPKKKVAAKKKKAAKPKPKPKPRKKKIVKPKPVKFKITAEMKPPKRSLTPYMTFHTDRVHASSGKFSNLAEAQDAVKSSAAVWKTLSDAQKQTYVDKAAAAREVYEKAMEQWYLTTSLHVRKELNKKRVAKGKSKIGKPNWMEKEPSSAYMRFAMAFKEGKDIPYVEALKQAKVAWANIPGARKEELKSVAQKEIAAFRAKKHATV
ncbi:uncharacterized protein BT62DRAFT_1080823 [Guyanagaster necrorhizus]|uniref:HMG box domain-containing protein n=1 Tax=Guyanagaster necrorhizus TaxID=856835 RepID=A0A9P7VGB3_9AGAR|nr:uncharacterized protein BT62DRAFT_1080823 [Guyanagaster necrorhizus MCA 3950]KAG7440446.1 hypothetical protein BT62DRAFT_1080823 [Guyanagaster necrorhizus MCA 3950]